MAGVGRGAAGLPRPVEAWGGESPGCRGRRGDRSRQVVAASGGMGRGAAGLPRLAWGVEPLRGEKRRKEVLG
jgi:hypothetical protein